MNNNNIDMNKLIGMISKMDKKQLENTISKANEIMNSPNREKLIDELKKNMN